MSNSDANGAPYGREQALAWIESTKLMLGSRAGFNWLKADLDELAGYVARVSDENSLLNSYLDAREERGEFERFAAKSRKPPLA